MMQTIASQTLNAAPPTDTLYSGKTKRRAKVESGSPCQLHALIPTVRPSCFFVGLAFCRRPEWLAVDVLWRCSWKSCEKSRGNSDEELPGDSYHAPAFDPPATHHWPHGHRDSPAGRRQCPALPCCPDEATGPIEAPFARIAAEKSAVSTRCITL